MRVAQNPAFTLIFDSMVMEPDEIALSDKQIEEGLGQWKHTLAALVVGTEVTKTAIERFIQARWKQAAPPVVTKQAGVFLLRLKSAEDLN